MSATLTWYHAGPQSKTGTALADFFTDLKGLVDSTASDDNFTWTVASSNLGSSPYYVVLKPKSGAAGRVLFVAYSSTPAGSNSAIFDVTVALNCIYSTFFPNGNVDSPSNLTASSGTILGDDTEAIRAVLNTFTHSNVYSSGVQLFCFDSTEAFVLGLQNPAVTTSCYMAAMGNIVVDANDDAYPAVLRSVSSFHNFGSANSIPVPWTTSSVSTGANTAAIMTNYGSAHTPFFMAFAPAGSFAGQTGANDVLVDSSVSRAYFMPCPLLSRVKGQGFALKLRQIGWGPSSSAAFSEYATTGPVTAARQFCAATVGAAGYPWFTNFKL